MRSKSNSKTTASARPRMECEGESRGEDQRGERQDQDQQRSKRPFARAATLRQAELRQGQPPASTSNPATDTGKDCIGYGLLVIAP